MSIPSLKMEIYYLPRKATTEDVEMAVLLKLREVDPLLKGPATKNNKFMYPSGAGGSWIVTFDSLEHARLFQESARFSESGVYGATNLVFPTMGLRSLREEGVSVQFRMLHKPSATARSKLPQGARVRVKQASDEVGEPKSPMRVRANA